MRPTVRRALIVALGVFSAGPDIARAHPGTGIVRDSRGNVYYTDLKQVWRISPSGDRSIAMRNVHTHELYVDSADNVFGEHLWYEGEVTGRWGHRVWRLSPSGEIVDIIPVRNGFRDDHDEFHFDWDAHGSMYWMDRGDETVLRRRDASGGVTVLAENIRSAGRFTVTANGTVYVVAGSDLLRIGTDGARTILARRLEERRASELLSGDDHNIMGLWTDARGNVYLAVRGGRMVKMVDPRGQTSIVARSESPWGPTGGLVDPSGDLWLLESSDSNAVRVRRLHGSTVIATYR